MKVRNWPALPVLPVLPVYFRLSPGVSLLRLRLQSPATRGDVFIFSGIFVIEGLGSSAKVSENASMCVDNVFRPKLPSGLKKVRGVKKSTNVFGSIPEGAVNVFVATVLAFFQKDWLEKPETREIGSLSTFRSPIRDEDTRLVSPLQKWLLGV